MRLYNHCVDYVAHHIEITSSAVDEAQQAVNGETKNTAGDRYEIDRAMKQRETELFGIRLEEAIKQRELLQAIDIAEQYDSVQPGSLVTTSLGSFFIAVSADEIEIDGEEYSLVSPESPIGQVLANKGKGDRIVFRGKTVNVLDVC